MGGSDPLHFDSLVLPAPSENRGPAPLFVHTRGRAGWLFNTSPIRLTSYVLIGKMRCSIARGDCVVMKPTPGAATLVAAADLGHRRPPHVNDHVGGRPTSGMLHGNMRRAAPPLAAMLGERGGNATSQDAKRALNATGTCWETGKRRRNMLPDT